jgi:hypothetical protein
MPDPICVYCREPIRPTDDKVTVYGTPYHWDCWVRKKAEV